MTDFNRLTAADADVVELEGSATLRCTCGDVAELEAELVADAFAWGAARCGCGRIYSVRLTLAVAEPDADHAIAHPG